MRDRKINLFITMAVITVLAALPTVTIWLMESGVVEFARMLRKEFLTGTAITLILVLLYLLPNERAAAPKDEWPFD